MYVINFTKFYLFKFGIAANLFQHKIAIWD